MPKTVPDPGEVWCPICGSNQVWDNREEKTTGARKATYPDWRCRECHAVGWLNRDGNGWTWKPDTNRHFMSKRTP